ncbi:MAG TPA: class I SAM-dependent methyltransferase [Thermoanaerobaculia bacterium]|nr:class I SAM-dependent methyltransferase [Thermoanaerobaculia bacterium]
MAARAASARFLCHAATLPLESYDAFAFAYDQALGHRFFRAVRPLVERTSRRYPLAGKTHLDVACGTGLVVAHFQSQGWWSVGVDASPTMLRIAATRARNLVAGDFAALPFRGPFARITCLYDSLNHVRRWNELVAAFRSMRGVMDADSILMFDVNHPDAYVETWQQAEPFVSSAADHHLEIVTTFRPGDGLARALVTGWAMRGPRRIAIHERREQRAWTPKQIERALAAAGLVAIERIDFDPFRNRSRRGRMKLFFVCRIRTRRGAVEDGRRGP